jgi:multiple sugar transport system substrate-binding protein
MVSCGGAGTEVAERQPPLELHALSTGLTVFGSYAPNQVAAVQGALTKLGKPGTFQLIKEPNGPAGSGDAIGTNGLTIGANCDNVPASAAFINFFLNDPQAAAAYKSDNGAVSSTPLLQAQIDDPSSSPPLIAQLKFQQHLTSGGFVKDIKYAAGYAALSPLLRTTYENVAFRRQTIPVAVDDFFTQANAILNK